MAKVKSLCMLLDVVLLIAQGKYLMPAVSLISKDEVLLQNKFSLLITVL